MNVLYKILATLWKTVKIGSLFKACCRINDEEPAEISQYI